MDKEQSKTSDFNNKMDFKLFNKIFGPIKILLKLHLKVAREELKKDMARYVAGFFSLILSLLCLVMLCILMNVLIILLFKNLLFYNLASYAASILSVLSTCAVNVIFFIIMLAIAIKKFNYPFLKETKKIVQETMSELK